MRVKGTLMLEYVKLVRSNKDKPWDQYLTDQDWEIIHSRILPSNWYPYESFVRIGQAVFKEIAQGNLELVRVFGRFAAKNVLNLYKNILVPGDPLTSVERLARLRRTFLDAPGAETQVVAQSSNSLRYRILMPEGERNKEYALAFSYQVAGNVEEIVEQAGGKKVESKVEQAAEGWEVLVTWK